MNEIVLNVNVTGGNQLAVSKVCIGGLRLVVTHDMFHRKGVS